MTTKSIKIAVLIVGEYRTFAQCRRTMTFLNDPKVDVYFSTWDTTNTLNPLINKIGPHTIKPRKVSFEEIQRALNIPHANIKIHKKPEHNDTFLIMREGWFLGMQMVIDSGKDYDFIYVMRPDLYYEDKFVFKDINYNKYENSIGLLSTPDKNNNADDTSFFSTYSNIKKLLNTDVLKIHQTPEEENLHVVWFKYISDKGLSFTKMPYSSSYVIGRYPITNNTTWEEAFTQYWNLFHNRPI